MINSPKFAHFDYIASEFWLSHYETLQLLSQYSNPSQTRGSKLAKFSNSQFLLFSNLKTPKLTFDY